MQFKIGADPEFFLLRSDGQHWSGHGIIPGTKKAPHKVEKGAVQLDGMAAEFNIEPAETEQQFIGNINVVLARLRAMVPAEYEFDFSPVAFFSEEHMKEQPNECKQLGCDPDFNAYTCTINEPPDASGNMRTAAGHVHIGWGERLDPFDLSHVDSCVDAVKQLDIFLGIPSVVMDRNTQRRQMYGKAGAFRPKSYGVEYRVMSNFWLKNPGYMTWVYRTTNAAMQRLAAGDRVFDRYDGEEIQRVINTSDYLRAGEIMREVA